MIKLPTTLTTPTRMAKLLRPAATTPQTPMRKQKATVVLWVRWQEVLLATMAATRWEGMAS